MKAAFLYLVVVYNTNNMIMAFPLISGKLSDATYLPRGRRREYFLKNSDQKRLEKRNIDRTLKHPSLE